MENKDNKIITQDYIKDLIKNIESNIIGCLWKSPDLFLQYSDLTMDNFINDIWQFYFLLGKKMAIKGIKKIDEVVVELFLERNDNLLNKYRKLGGYGIIKNLEFFCTIENLEVYIKELKKWNTVYKTIGDLTLNEDKLNTIKDFKTDEIYNYFIAKLSHIFINSEDDIETSKLNENLDEIIDIAHQGLNRGMEINSPILSNEIGGWMNGQVYLMGGLSGAGKTSITQEIILPKIWQLNEPCVIMLNEQDDVKWKQQFLTWIINNIILKDTNKKFNAKRWRQGEFTQEEFKWLKEAKIMLNEKEASNKIIFVHFKSYSQSIAERVIRKYASLGITKFILDTFKLSSNRDDEAFWLSMQEDMRKYDDLVKPSNLNVALWCTLQLQKGSRLLRYLTSDNIGMAKNVLDVASVALLMRRLWNDEYTGQKNAIEVRMPIAGTESYKNITLDPKKIYVIIFIEKNRNGESQTYQVVAEQDLGGLIYKEIGICDIACGS